MLLTLILLQAAPASGSPPPERFSILLPCQPGETGARTDEHGEVVVCGDGGTAAEQRVPVPETYVYKTPRPSNPALTGVAALNAEATPCAASQWGCASMVGPPIVPIVKAVAGLIGDALRPKPDKTGRVAIPLDDTTPLPGFRVGEASTSATPAGSATP
jgi:hypothetical protein